MTFFEIEQLFNRSIRFSCSRKKVLLVFPNLLMCGLLILLCRTLAFDASSWVTFSLSFLPIFLCSGLLASLGVLLTRIYYHEIKGHTPSYKKIFMQSIELFIGASYLTLPILLVYVVLWTKMGIFYLIKGLPLIGKFIGICLSFAPVLLVFASLVLCLLSTLVLFFLPSHMALQGKGSFTLALEIYKRIKENVFTNLVLFLLALAPVLIVVGFLMMAAGFAKVDDLDMLGTSLQWLFMMIPFCMVLTPLVCFFFNFATESYGLIKRRSDERSEQKEECASQS